MERQFTKLAIPIREFVHNFQKFHFESLSWKGLIADLYAIL